MNPADLNNLTRRYIAIGAMLFIVLMYADIWAFGRMMQAVIPKLAFKPIGRVILVLMAAMILAAWSPALSQDLRVCIASLPVSLIAFGVAFAAVELSIKADAKRAAAAGADPAGAC